MAITYNNLYLDIRRILKKAGMDSSTLVAREIVCTAAGKTSQEFYRDAGLYTSPQVEQQSMNLLKRHLEGEPIAYIVGEWEFYGLPLDISASVLIPRFDTEVLVDTALSHLKEQGSCRVLDLCSGSGCIGIAIAKNAPSTRVILGDLSEEALKVCRQNTRRNSVTNQVSSMQMNALEPPPTMLDGFTAIISNPPYIPTKDITELDVSVKSFEPHMALDGGDDGLDFYRSIAKHWKRILLPQGKLYFEVGIHQANDVLRIMTAEGFGDIQIVPDTAGIPRVVYGTLSHL